MSILQQDLEELSQYHIDFEKFRNKSILVTGATGMIGSLFIKAMLYCSHKYDLKIQIIGIARNRKKVEKIFPHINLNNELKFYFQDIREPITIENNFDYILHTASITQSRTMINKPIEVLTTSFYGTENVLKLAVGTHAKLVYLSSMEVYGQVPLDHCENVTEKDLGYIDLNNVRNCYCEAKRVCESLCISYYHQKQIPVVIARLAQTFGAGISKSDNRVFAQFARAVVNHDNIILHTTGQSEGNYCYTIDVIYALLLLFSNGQAGNIYNVSNEECHTTIATMAEMVSKTFANGLSKVIFDIPKNQEMYGYAPDVKMKLDSSKLKKLGWNPHVDLTEAYNRTIQYFLNSMILK